MIRKPVFLVMIFLSFMGLLAGCSRIKQSDLDAANAAKTAAEAQVASLQSQLTAANTAKTKAETDLAMVQQNLTMITAERDSAKSQLDKAKADLTSAQANLNKSMADLTTTQANLSKSSTDLAAAQQSFSALNTSVKTYQPYVETSTLWFDMWANSASWNQSNWDTWNVKFAAAISNSQDSAMQTLLNTMRTTTGSEHENAEMALTNLLIKRLNEKLPKTN